MRAAPPTETSGRCADEGSTIFDDRRCSADEARIAQIEVGFGPKAGGLHPRFGRASSRLKRPASVLLRGRPSLIRGPFPMIGRCSAAEVRIAQIEVGFDPKAGGLPSRREEHPL